VPIGGGATKGLLVVWARGVAFKARELGFDEGGVGRVTRRDKSIPM
jgi:hypothetical protein